VGALRPSPTGSESGHRPAGQRADVLLTIVSRDLPQEWDAATYHRVSAPQVSWGSKVLGRLALVGDETVVDAGCGTGRLTADLLERLPRGRVIAVDRSTNMLAEAAAYLVPRYGDRVSFVQADVQDLELPEPVGAIFSTATFHWVLDHPRLFGVLFACLKPGGRLVAQCGGGPNIARLRRRAESLLESPDFLAKAVGWTNPWEFATPDETARRLAAAGFTAIETSLEPAPTTFSDAPAFSEFVESVVLRAHLDALPDEADRRAFMAQVTALAANDDPPFTLDYWRLNLAATRPNLP
jgi:trans-aconitate 2-methyltransferase